MDQAPGLDELFVLSLYAAIHLALFVLNRIGLLSSSPRTMSSFPILNMTIPRPCWMWSYRFRATTQEY